MSAKNNRVGEEMVNSFGSRMTIVEYNNANDIVIMFDGGYSVKSIYADFKRGFVRSVYDKTVFEVGYIGEGVYRPTIDGVITTEYHAWANMLERCYNDKYKTKNPTYKDCKASEEWHNFQNFAEWHSENYYTIGDEIMCLDKDILNKGNKVYSSDTCIFAPKSINSLFPKGDNIRGDLPVGVVFDKSRNKYMSRCNDGFGKNTYLGRFDTAEEAFYAYKAFKEKAIKNVAEHYKDKIPNRLYEAMITYEVEIDD